jgi:DNA-binding response OmpR family regulator
VQEAATVLVADDDNDIAQLMRDYLEADGHTVLIANDGDSTLDALDRHPVSCVLLDVMMPGLSGFDVLRRIRETTDVPVLMLSALGGDSDKLRGLGLGADDYIVKSASASEVVARVRAVLRRAGQPGPAVRPRWSSTMAGWSSTSAPTKYASTANQHRSRRGSSSSSSTSPVTRARSSPATSCSGGSGTPTATPTRSRCTSAGSARRSRRTQRIPATS